MMAAQAKPSLQTPLDLYIDLEETASGCTATESVEVIGVILPEISLGDDQTTCPYEPVSFDFPLQSQPVVCLEWPSGKRLHHS